MVRAVDRKYTFWVAGYYDDFIGAKVMPDEQNTPGLTWYSSKTHQGNPINGWASLNPRYTYAWCVRGDGDSAQFNNPGITTTTRYAFNSGVDKWLGVDENRRNSTALYEGLVQVQYPDSLTTANRQKFDGGTGIVGGATKAYETTATESNYAVVEGYMMFCNGYDTSKKYYAATGTNDSTFGRDTQAIPDANTGAALIALAGLPQTLAARSPGKIVRTHLAGVYSGEVVSVDDIDNSHSSWGAGQPRAWLYPVTSPTGKPFLSIEAYTTSASYDPILSYDGSLNSKGDGDIFTIRIYPSRQGADAKIRLRIGCEGTAFTSVVGGDTGYSHAAIDYEITPDPFTYGGFAGLGNWSDTHAKVAQDRWDDYDFIMNYTAGTYDIVKNGASVSTGNALGNTSAGVKFKAADMYGWQLDAKDAEMQLTVLIDRVGLIRPINDYPLSTTEMPPVPDFSLNSTINSSTTVKMKVIDDDTQLSLLSFFNQDSYSDSTILLFRDNIDRPIWRGTLQSMTYKSDANKRTPTIELTASDFFDDLDKSIPTWELGSSGEGDNTSQVAYNRADSQHSLNVFYFGAEALSVANATLGFDEGTDGDGIWKNHLDSRMRRSSAHPIQVYNGEDEIGPNNPYADWDTAIGGTTGNTGAQYRALHSRWIKDLPKSTWFRHMFGKIKKDVLVDALTTSTFTVGSSTTLTIDTPPLLDTTNVSFEILNSDGFIDHGVATSIASVNTVTPNYIRLYQEKPNPFDVIFGITFKGFIVFQIAASLGVADGDYVNISGLANSTTGNVTGNESSINGIWQVKKFKFPSLKQSIGGVQYRNYVLCRANGHMQEHLVDTNITSTPLPAGETGYVTKNISTQYIGYNPMTAREIGSLGSGSTIGYGGATLTLPTTNFLQRNHAVGSTLRIRNIDDDFKHIWVLWADMRNDGNANADAMTRDKKFGLLMPYSGNYNLSLGISETNVSVTEERTNFVDLNLGEDIDLWQMDATADPITGNPWSAVSGGSNSESNSKYHTWESKAGSFVIIDTSKFFNLNTTSNNGKAGQASGGRKEVGDFLTETEGFPVLVDNYWAEAIVSYNNFNEDTASAGSGSPLLWSPNYKYLINNTTTLAADLLGSTGNLLQVNDEGPIIHNIARPSGLPQKTEKTGRLFSGGSVIALTSEKKKRIFHVLLQSKLPPVTSAPTSAGGLIVQPYTYLDGSAVDRPNANMASNQFCINLQTGTAGGNIITGTTEARNATITLSNFAGTTTDLSGEYVIDDIVSGGIDTGTGFKEGPWAVFTIKSTAATPPTVTAGTCHWEIKNAWSISRLMDLGVPVPGTKVIGEWDGSGYSETCKDYFDTGVSTYVDGASFPWSSTSSAGIIKINDATGWVAPGYVTDGVVGGGDAIFSAGEVWHFTSVNTSTTPPQLEGCTQVGGTFNANIGTSGRVVYQIPAPENNAEYLVYWNAITQPYTNSITIKNVSEDDATANNQSANSYTDILVRSGLANIFPMRLLMSLTGFVESKGTGTWYDSDKLRVTYADCLNKNWLSQSSVKGIPDIGTVPVTKDMVTVYDHYIDSASGVGLPGQGGYISGIAAPSGGYSVVTVTAGHGLSGGETITILSSDHLGFPTGSKDYVVSDTGSSPVTFKIPRTAALSSGTVFGRWRRASRIDQYGGVNDCRNESYANIYQSTQQKSGLGENGIRKVFSWIMSRDAKPAFRPNYSIGYTFDNTNLSVSNMSTSNKEQITNVRVFYAGNGSYVDYPTASLNSSPRWEILQVPEITSTPEATEYAKGQYEKRKLAPLSINAKITRLDNSNTILGNNSNMISGARFGYVADQSRTIPYSYSTSGTPASSNTSNWAWNSLYGGNLFPGMVSALDGRDGDCARPNNTSPYDFDDNYWWYGSNSISYAVQVVHIPRNMPKTTQKTAGVSLINADGRLRMVIDIVDTLGADVGYDNLEFKLSLIDYDWSDNIFAPTSRSISSVQFDANGYYEIDIPSTYWSTGRSGNERIVVSLNYEYLKALVRERCPATNYTRNGNSYGGKTHSTLNTGSIFPLGMRKINSSTDYWGDKAEWYAPRLEITDDINFHPATNLIYTDAAMGIESEVLGIKSIGWNVRGNKETVTFTLERDVSRSAKGLMSFFGTGGLDEGPWKPNPPPTGGTPGGVPLDPGAGQGGWPSQGGFGFVGGYGAIAANTPEGSQFDPITLAGTGGNPIGTTMSSNSPTILNTNNVGQGLNNNIKGTMDFNTDSVTGGTFSVLGQRKPSQAPLTTNAIEGIDSFITPIAGDAVMGDDGMSFAGATDAAKAYTAFAMTSRVPNNVVNPSVTITGRYSLANLNELGTPQVAALTVKVECVETGSAIEETVPLNSGTNRFTTLFSNNLAGLDVPNNTIKVTIGREAGTAPDTAQYAALVLHNVQIESDRRSVSGASEAQSYSFGA